MRNSITATCEIPFEGRGGVKMLMLGDVMGLAGVKAVTKILPEIRRNWDLSFVVVNGENANGFGMIPESAKNLLSHGADVLTGGNHTLRPSAIHKTLMRDPRVLRPHNLGSIKTPGKGVGVFESPHGKVAVINLIGQVFMEPSDSPFNAFDNLHKTIAQEVDWVLVDFHAEATGEKVSFALHCDGRATFVAGTHTHVPTADERVTQKGTGAITDLGLCGSVDSVIGMEPGAILSKSRHALPSRFNPAKSAVHIQGVVMLLDPPSHKAIDVIRVDIPSG